MCSDRKVRPLKYQHGNHLDEREPMNFKPLGDKILVKPDQMKEKTSGGILLAEQAKEKSNRGTVIRIGNELTNKFETKPGDRVVFGIYSGTEVLDDDEQVYLVMREDELFSLII